MLRAICVTIILIISNAMADIISTDSTQEIMEEISKSSEIETFIIFDCDEVLLMQTDQILHINFVKEFLKYIEKMESKCTDEEKLINAASEILKEGTVDFVDRDMLRIVKKAQACKHFKVFVCTQCGTGSFGKIHSLEDFREQQLKKLGYDFAKGWQLVKRKEFKELAVQIKNKKVKSSYNYPVFQNGILCTCNATKGDSIEAFCKYIKIKPKKIVFIDDSLKHIKSVEQMCIKERIEFVGIEYTKAKKKNVSEKLCKSTADFQFKTLEEKCEWLTDEQTQSLMNKSTKS